MDQATLMVMPSNFFGWRHIWIIASLEIKMKQTENNTMLYFFKKNEATLVLKESLEKLEISILKRETADILVVEMMVSGEIYDKFFYQMILGKKLLIAKMRF